MTTIYPFEPSPQAPFQFQPTLDGQQYSVVVPWNVTGQRYYLNVFDLAGNRIVTIPLIGSPDVLEIRALAWANGRAIVTTIESHGLVVGTPATWTVSDCTPEAYNGTFQVTAMDSNRVFYNLTADPGDANILGTIGRNIDILGAYFRTSSLIFRESLNRFEVNP